jgi:hypothetical protein
MFDIGHFRISNKKQNTDYQQLNNGISIVKPGVKSIKWTNSLKKKFLRKGKRKLTS